MRRREKDQVKRACLIRLGTEMKGSFISKWKITVIIHFNLKFPHCFDDMFQKYSQPTLFSFSGPSPKQQQQQQQQGKRLFSNLHVFF